MKKKPIDPIDIKQAIKNGQLTVFEKNKCVYIQDGTHGDCIKIYEFKEDYHDIRRDHRTC